MKISRRAFVAMGGVLLGGLSLQGLRGGVFASEAGASKPLDAMDMPNPRQPLIVKPILVHNVAQRREAASWRNWGCIQSVDDANAELGRIKGELDALQKRVDFPIEFLETARVTHIDQMNDHPDIEKCDTILLYPAGHNINGVQKFNKDVVIFMRWDSGPVYRHIITISARFLRQHTDEYSIPGIRPDDVVVDDPKELDWRFRALCGLKNTMNAKWVTIGGASGWATRNAPEIAKNNWKFEYHDVSYAELRKIIAEAEADAKLMARSRQRAEDYLGIPETKMETKMDFLVRAFMLDEIFRMLMKKVGTNNITVNSCMGAIMPASKTTACLTLTTLMDDGYQAYCESDFVVIPGATLLSNISGKPVFFGNPCFPKNDTATVCHCAAPRKMDGKNFDPMRIVTHYESDYGASPWIKYRLGTETTHIIAGFKSDRWVGFKGSIVDIPFKPSSCRTQVTYKHECTDELLANNLIGFHWSTCFGDYRKEVGYALRRVGITWDNLDKVPKATKYT
jgi:hypothetical protein